MEQHLIPIVMDVFGDRCCQPDTMVFKEHKWELDIYWCSVCGLDWIRDGTIFRACIRIPASYGKTWQQALELYRKDTPT
tara:strand:+ start:260 stop:496 length:237 start_codon:yes stop_codon:yes gene_type:complete